MRAIDSGLWPKRRQTNRMGAPLRNDHTTRGTAQERLAARTPRPSSSAAERSPPIALTTPIVQPVKLRNPFSRSPAEIPTHPPPAASATEATDARVAPESGAFAIPPASWAARAIEGG